MNDSSEPAAEPTALRRRADGAFFQPNPRRKETIHANPGYAFPVAGRAQQIRLRTQREGARMSILDHFARLGWHTKRVEICGEVPRPDKPTLYYLDIGEEFSGICANELEPILRKIRQKIGQKAIREILLRLTQYPVPTAADAILEKVG